MPNEAKYNPFDSPENFHGEFKQGMELEQSIDEIWDNLDVQTQTPRTEKEIRELSLEELMYDSTVPTEFWREIPPEVGEQIRGLYRERIHRGIFTPPKIGKVLQLIGGPSEQIWHIQEKRELFLATLEGYVEERTHPRRHLAIDLFLEDYFHNKPFTLVDVGCSKGLITERLSRKFPKSQVVGIDIFFPADFDTTSKQANYIQADLITEHLPVSQVDCFICTSVWEHLAPHAAKRSLKSMAESLKENGLIIEGVIEMKDGRSGYIVLQKKQGRLNLINFLPYVERKKHE